MQKTDVLKYTHGSGDLTTSKMVEILLLLLKKKKNNCNKKRKIKEKQKQKSDDLNESQQTPQFILPFFPPSPLLPPSLFSSPSLRQPATLKYIITISFSKKKEQNYKGLKF